MKHIISGLTVLCLIMCVSCSEVSKSGGGYYGGEEISPDVLSEISSSVLEESLKDPNGNVQNPDQVVYWTQGGTAIHSSRKCTYIRSSTSIQTGTLGDAIRLGKSKYCSSCFKSK